MQVLKDIFPSRTLSFELTLPMLKASLHQAHPLKESKNTTPLPKRVRGIIANAFNPKYAIEITKLAKVIAPWAFTNNHQLTFGLTSNSLQTPTAQALSLILAILLHYLG